MATRKKYKIVLSEKYVRKSENGKEWFQFPVNISGQLVAIQTIIPLEPYTEPDMEQVRKEAYADGYKEGCDAKFRRLTGSEYQRGLNDAWECARTLWNTPNRKEIFGHTTFNTVLTTLTAQEAIEKIRQYEQEQEEQITKGDVIRIKSTPEVEILVIYADEEYVSGIALTEVDGNCEIGDQYTNIRISNVEKTGKHYDIVSVLQKMREESNG